MAWSPSQRRKLLAQIRRLHSIKPSDVPRLLREGEEADGGSPDSRLSFLFDRIIDQTLIFTYGFTESREIGSSIGEWKQSMGWAIIDAAISRGEELLKDAAISTNESFASCWECMTAMHARVSSRADDRIPCDQVRGFYLLSAIHCLFCLHPDIDPSSRITPSIAQWAAELSPPIQFDDYKADANLFSLCDHMERISQQLGSAAE